MFILPRRPNLQGLIKYQTLQLRFESCFTLRRMGKILDVLHRTTLTILNARFIPTPGHLRRCVILGLLLHNIPYRLFSVSGLHQYIFVAHYEFPRITACFYSINNNHTK